MTVPSEFEELDELDDDELPPLLDPIDPADPESSELVAELLAGGGATAAKLVVLVSEFVLTATGGEFGGAILAFPSDAALTLAIIGGGACVAALAPAFTVSVTVTVIVIT